MTIRGFAGRSDTPCAVKCDEMLLLVFVVSRTIRCCRRTVRVPANKTEQHIIITISKYLIFTLQAQA